LHAHELCDLIERLVTLILERRDRLTGR